jgi:hypothetical protein
MGDGRVRAAHLLGVDEVPCIVLAHLTQRLLQNFPDTTGVCRPPPAVRTIAGHVAASWAPGCSDVPDAAWDLEAGLINAN